MSSRWRIAPTMIAMAMAEAPLRTIRLTSLGW
jgi:hypothetical protein